MLKINAPVITSIRAALLLRASSISQVICRDFGSRKQSTSLFTVCPRTLSNAAVMMMMSY